MSIIQSAERAAEQAEDHATDDLKAFADHLVSALAALGDTHSVEFHVSVSITKKEQ